MEKNLQTVAQTMNWKYAVVAGSLAALLCIAGGVGLSSVSDFKAIQMIEAMQPSSRFLGSAIITGTSTILALMLTMLSFSSRLEKDSFEDRFYNIIYTLSFLSVVVLIGAVILLMLINIPLEQSQEVPLDWYDVIYNIQLIYSCLLGGLFITIILMLFNAIVALIKHYHPDSDTSLFKDDKNRQQEKEEERKETERQGEFQSQ